MVYLMLEPFVSTWMSDSLGCRAQDTEWIFTGDLATSTSIGPVVEISVSSLVTPSLDGSTGTFTTLADLTLSASIPAVVLRKWELSWDTFSSQEGSKLGVVLSR